MEIPIEWRDLQQIDLDLLGWSGGSAHLDAVEQALHDSWGGDADVLVGELPTGVLVGLGGVHYTRDPGTGRLWMLAVRPSWQGLGVGTALIAALEERVRERGLGQASLTVELDNPRAEALYRRLGYTGGPEVIESWPLDDGTVYRAPCRKLVHRLA